LAAKWKKLADQGLLRRLLDSEKKTAAMQDIQAGVRDSLERFAVGLGPEGRAGAMHKLKFITAYRGYCQGVTRRKNAGCSPYGC